MRELSRFAVGMGGINVLGHALTQLDKVVLSFLLPLREFGYYTLAWTLASLIYRISWALYNTVLPRMTELLARGDASVMVPVAQRGCGATALFGVVFLREPFSIRKAAGLAAALAALASLAGG